MSPISSPLSLPIPRWFPFLEHGCFSNASGDEVVLPSAARAAVSNPTLRYGSRCFSFISEMQTSGDNLGCSNLYTSNTKSQVLSIPLSDTPFAKMETKDDGKAREAVGALPFRTAISYPARKRKPEREGDRDNPQHNLLPQNNLLN